MSAALGICSRVPAGVKRLLIVLGCGVALQSCTPPVDTGLLSAVTPKSPSELTVSGPLLVECLSVVKHLVAEMKPDTVARFSAAATYKLADLMKRSPREVRRYADRVRGYVYPYEATSILGRNEFNLICYYGQSESGLTYLTSLTTDTLGSVRSEVVVGTVVKAYEKLSGRDLSFGESALLVLSIPSR